MGFGVKTTMISENLRSMLNDLVNMEFFSGYLYLSFSVHLKELGLDGFNNWTRHKAKNEVEHGLNLFDFLMYKRHLVTLNKIQPPSLKCDSLLNLFLNIKQHENSIKNFLKNIIYLAQKDECKDILIILDDILAQHNNDIDFLSNLTKQLTKFDCDKNIIKLLNAELIDLIK